MINRAIEVPALSVGVAHWELEDYGRGHHLSALKGVRVFSDHQNGIRLCWEIQDRQPRGVCLKAHEARALGQLLLDAVDDVAPYAKASR
jgi:hypothetical protein